MTPRNILWETDTHFNKIKNAQLQRQNAHITIYLMVQWILYTFKKNMMEHLKWQPINATSDPNRSSILVWFKTLVTAMVRRDTWSQTEHRAFHQSAKCWHHLLVQKSWAQVIF